MKLMENIYLAGSGASGYSHAKDCNLYCLDTGEGLALIDAGSGQDNQWISRNLESDGLDPTAIKWLINTHAHYDHAAGSRWFREETGCEVWIHESDADTLESGDRSLTLAEFRNLQFDPCPVDRRFKDGDRLAIGRYELEVIHTPGHSPGSVILSFQHNEDKTVWFAGDTVQPQGCLPILNIPGSDLYVYRDSINKLMDRKVDALFPGHGIFVFGNGKKHVESIHHKLHSPWRDIAHEIGDVIPRFTIR